MTNLRKKIRKILIALFSIIAVTLFIVSVTLYFEAQTYLNKNLSEFVYKKSKGKYQLAFENLEINFRHWGFDINQVSFSPTDSITETLDSTDTKKRFYSFSSPNIRVSGIRMIQLLFSKKLEIGEILINQPELNIHGETEKQDDKKNNIVSIIQELKPLVTKTFKSIKIDKIELSNASFDFYNLLGETKKLSNAENITIGILNFYTDSVLLPDPAKLFDAKDIYLRMQNYQIKLADSIHSLSAESVTYSLKQSNIEAKNLELKATNQNLTEKGKYYFFVPYTKITANHINEFYRNNTIPIDSIVLKDAIIKFWPGQIKTKSSIENITEFDLYELIKNEFSSVSIQNFKLKNASLMLFNSQTDQTDQQELKNIIINLKDFKLDSISNQDTSRIFYSKDISFSAADYELILGDNKHRIKVGNLELSTNKKSVLIKNIQLFPQKAEDKPRNQKNTIEASCDSVRLDQFNFKKAYHDNRFLFRRINLFNPEVTLTQNELADNKTEPENPSFIYNLISRYIKGIYSNQVTIQHGKIQIINKTGVLQTGKLESELKLQLTGFALDETSAKRTDRLFFANQIELGFSKYEMQLVDQLHKLTIRDLSISTHKNQAQLHDLHLFPVMKENMDSLLKKYARSELFEFTIPELTLSNTDFHQAFFNKKLSVDTLQIKEPKLFYENFALLKNDKPKADFEDLFQLLSSYLEDIHINHVEIPDGTIKVISHSKKDKTISLDNHFRLSMENTLINKYQFDQKRLLFSEFVDFSVRDHLIHLSDNVHVLKAGEIGFSTRRKEIYVTNARLYPESDSKDFSTINWNIQLIVPEIRIKGIDMEEFYFDHKINAENLLINTPDIKLYQKRKNTDKKELKEINFPLPKEIQSIDIKSFNLKDGSLKVFAEMGIKPYLMIQSDLKMSAQNILIQKDPLAHKPVFKKGEYTGKLVQFKFTPKDKNQQFSIDELSFSTNNKQILASNLSLKPKTRNQKQDQFELFIPSLSMNGFDIDEAYRNDQFNFESIIVDRPSLQLYNNEKDSAAFNPFKINLYPHFESFSDVFSSKTLQVINAGIATSKNGQKKRQETVSFNLTNLRIEKKQQGRFLHSEDFSFKIPNITREVKLYKYTIGETSYSSKSNRFTAKDIQVTPKFTKEKHQQQIGFQSDYFSGKIDSVCIESPNIKQWFENKELVGKNLSINGMNLNIYRDKKMPFDETRRPPTLQDLIKSLKYQVLIDSLTLKDSKVSYSELPPNGDLEGKIRFKNINAKLAPFTNIKNLNGSFPNLSLNGSATIMDSTQLNVKMHFLMNHPENEFTAEGNLSPFHMTILNPVLEPLAMISLRSGDVNRFEFNFTADNNIATGQLFFGYDDLKISVLEMKDGNAKEAKFTSFLANSLLLRSKNPRGKEFLPEEINFHRDQKRSVLNYWWKSVFSGIRNTLGIKDKEQEAHE